MKILITGGNGFIGSALIPALLQEGHTLVIISHSTDKIIHEKNVETIRGKYDDDSILAKCLPQTDLIIHLAYSTVPENSVLDPMNDVRSNVIPTLKLLQAMKKFQVKKMIFISSGGVVYGNSNSECIKESEKCEPISSYGITKLINEKNITLLAESLGIECCILRLANAYGHGQHNRRNQGVINIWMNKIRNGEQIQIMGDGEQIRDYVHIDDIVNAIGLVIKNKLNGTFNIGTGVGTSLNQLIKIIERELAKNASIVRLKDRGYDVRSNVLDSTLFSQKSGWKSNISIEEGIKRMI